MQLQQDGNRNALNVRDCYFQVCYQKNILLSEMHFTNQRINSLGMNQTTAVLGSPFLFLQVNPQLTIHFLLFFAILLLQWNYRTSYHAHRNKVLSPTFLVPYSCYIVMLVDIVSCEMDVDVITRWQICLFTKYVKLWSVKKKNSRRFFPLLVQKSSIHKHAYIN